MVNEIDSRLETQDFRLTSILMDIRKKDNQTAFNHPDRNGGALYNCGILWSAVPTHTQWVAHLCARLYANTLIGCLSLSSCGERTRYFTVGRRGVFNIAFPSLNRPFCLCIHNYWYTFFLAPAQRTASVYGI